MMIPLITAAVIGFYMMFNGFGQMDTLIQQMMAGKSSFKEQAEAFERGFDEWLGSTFLPQALAAVKRKKHLHVKEKAE